MHDHTHQHSLTAEDPAALAPKLPAPHPELSLGCSPVPWPLGAATSLVAHPLAPLGHGAPSVPPDPPATAASGPAQSHGRSHCPAAGPNALQGGLCFPQSTQFPESVSGCSDHPEHLIPLASPQGHHSPSKTRGATPDLAQEHSPGCPCIPWGAASQSVGGKEDISPCPVEKHSWQFKTNSN